MKASPEVSIIIVARDEEENLARCLAAVRAQRTTFSYEVLVVDSGSRDRTAEVARGFGARVLSIAREDFQHGRTRQTASEQAKGEFIVHLVADAVPADEKWLHALVSAVAEDEKVAGAYSRQVPRDGAGPLEAHRLAHRSTSGSEKVIKEIGDGDDFWSWSAEERFRFCEFDDVSSCRRRSVLNQIPIPPVDWAEDLLWAKEALLRGYKIVYEPDSVVKHSHQDTLAHAFRRGYLDQLAVKRGFGFLYFNSLSALLRGYPRLLLDQTRAVMTSELSLFRKPGLVLWNAARLAAEVAGNFGATMEPREEHVVYDLVEVMTRTTLPMVEQGKGILKTWFALGEDCRKTLFMNPNRAAAARLKIPPRASLKFAAGLNPQARPMRKEPVLFAVFVDDKLLWHSLISPGQKGDKPAWEEAELDLSPWAGKRVKITLATRAENTDYAWAGWGQPRVAAPALSLRDKWWNRIAAAAAQRALASPLRHP